jgi:hypothetical protein
MSIVSIKNAFIRKLINTCKELNVVCKCANKSNLTEKNIVLWSIENDDPFDSFILKYNTYKLSFIICEQELKSANIKLHLKIMLGLEKPATDCIICFENLNVNESITCPQCNARIHCECLAKLVDANIHKCAQCRYDYLETLMPFVFQRLFG